MSTLIIVRSRQEAQNHQGKNIQVNPKEKHQRRQH